MKQNTLLAALHELLTWYQNNKRDLPFRGTRDPYKIWLSEIMLQQTRAAAVVPYFERFVAALPNVRALAAVDEDVLMKLWEGLGYYSRARNLKKCALVLVNEYGGQFPQEYDELIKLPGIGFYTAGAISSIAFGRPVPAVDGNVLRVMSRLENDASDVLDMSTRRRVFAELSECYEKWNGDKPAIEADLAARPFGDLNQAFMDFGSGVCIPKAPKCETCPLRRYCEAYEEGHDRVLQLPVRKKKKEKRLEHKTVLIIGAGDFLLLHRRPDKGLLAGLFEFPNVPGELSENEALDAVRKLGFEPLYIKRTKDVRHVFTHVIWDMRCYFVRTADPKDFPGGSAGAADMVADALSSQADWLWVRAREAGENVPIPTAFAKCYNEVN